MSVLLTHIEFFAYEREVWYRMYDGPVQRFEEKSKTLVDAVVEYIETFYPKAYAALAEEYRGSSRNLSYYKFLIASRFIRCNFAPLDNVPDISLRAATFEYVSCPLRGECRFESIVCSPEFNHKLSAAELRVMKLWCEGASESEIALRLHVSPCTVHNHIANAYRRTGLHTRHEFVAYAVKHNIFE